ncbi:MAG: UvrD-helicase domain-containing protein [Spirochaetaceae bacterium]|jgi:uncharacterized protein (TIGR00375 family)|nr:UvrD-helicase domain-containing protein [Spirochaetaceae bacterium]
MRIIADLHIHSHYSRATSAKLVPSYLEHWARIKGIQLLGTGDCTHPAWLRELREQLDEAEEGFFTLKKQVRTEFAAKIVVAEELPTPIATTEPRFVLTGEVSTIYKQGEKTRKVHHLVILPHFKAAVAFQTALERLGNIRSDGRPILGISSLDLFSLLLDIHEQALLIPAHIWTPWFSVLGEKSGFDSLDDCYQDFTPYLSAVETGLSSNPPMNWAVSSLDRFSIISNSDAHSLDKLGREATVFDMDMSYSALSAALARSQKQSGAGIIETVEFFPQEGKYHYDGHRKCNVYLSPQEAQEAGGLCPVCHKTLTRGVMGRVLELADRPVDESELCPPESGLSNKRPYCSLIPLNELLGELLGVGSSSRKVKAAYNSIIAKAEGELSFLMTMPLSAIEKLRCSSGIEGELLARAVDRMRKGDVFIRAGFDGEFGVIRVFPGGQIHSKKESVFFEELNTEEPAPKLPKVPALKPELKQRKASNKAARPQKSQLFSFHPEQRKLIHYTGQYTCITAGPGTGKTATIAAHIVQLIKEGTDSGTILALSFTVKAALELRQRITRILGSANAVTTATFHSLCASILRDHCGEQGIPKDFTIINDSERAMLLQELCRGAPAHIKAAGLSSYIEARKRFLLRSGESTPCLLAGLAEELGLPQALDEFEYLYTLYTRQLADSAQLDFDDLVAETVRLLAAVPALLSHYQRRFRQIFIDEYQDINFAQYALVTLLAQETLWVIGDPNQAIYGFRGSDKRFMDRFLTDYPQAVSFTLRRSFRCGIPLLKAAGMLMNTSLEGNAGRVSLYRSEYATEKAEAEGIARRISQLIGGTTFFAFDSTVVESGSAGETSPEQTLSSLESAAVLIRTSALAAPLIKAFLNHGIPYALTGEKPWWETEPVQSVLGVLRTTTSSLSPSETIKQILIDDPSIPASSLINRLIDLAAWYDDLPTFLDAVAVSGEHSDMELHPEGVRIMTIHAAKGLEFEHVFIAGLEEGVLPFTLYEPETDERIAEERRLLYVAMTRAKTGLYLSWARRREFQKRHLENKPSRFLVELEPVIPLSTEKGRNRDRQLSLF